MNSIILGNFISFIASVLLGLSCITRHPKRVYMYQIIEDLVYIGASVIFGSYSAAISTFLAVVRLYIVLKDKYTKKVMIVFCVALAVLGAALNTKGLVGLLPVLATIEFAAANYYFKEIKGIKWSLIVNLVLWDIYAFVIQDYVSGITWAVLLAVTSVSLYRVYKDKPLKK